MWGVPLVLASALLLVFRAVRTICEVLMLLLLLLFLLLRLYLLALFYSLFLILVLPLFLLLPPLVLFLCLLLSSSFFASSSFLFLFPLPLSSSGSASLLSSLPPPSPLSPTPAFPSPFAPPSLSSRSSFSASALLPPPPPGFPPLPPSVSSSLPPFYSSSSAVQAASLVVAFSSSSLDFASYQASVLGLTDDYQCLARWYFQSGGSDFRAYLSAFYPQLSSDASRDFASGSSVFFSALCSVASSVPLSSVSSSAPPPPVSSAALVFSQSLASLPLAPPFCAPSSVPLPSSLGSLSVAQGWGASVLGSASGVSSAPPGFPPLSAPSSSLCLQLQLLLLCLWLLLCWLRLPLPPLPLILLLLASRLQVGALLRLFRWVLRVLSLPSF